MEVRFFALVLFLIPFLNCNKKEPAERTFTIDYDKNRFVKDGETFRYISGGMHYFRIPRVYWDDRIKKARAMGLNTIQTYVAWNTHALTENVYDFHGNKDIVEFIKTAQRNDLLVILRPGPYIDAEWDFGGFPWWMAKYEMNFRTSDKNYKRFVERWYKVLLPMIGPLLYKNGGPIIAFQVENEYGSYFACDKQYLLQLKDMLQNHLGDDVILFTTDGYQDSELKCGTRDDIFKTIDFGTEIKATEAFKKLRKFQNSGPLVNSEYYTGWLDYWGGKHHTRDAKEIASHFQSMLGLENVSINLYMFHGGTNFGFMNGADIDGSSYKAVPTSYDYDAPLTEAGDPTKKYFALREVIQSFAPQPLPPVPSRSEKIAYGKVSMKSYMTFPDFVKIISRTQPPVFSQHPLNFADLGCGYGFVLYETRLNKAGNITITVHDRSTVYLNGEKQAVLKRGNHSVKILTGNVLHVLVENQGRIAYAPTGSHYFRDRKGIIGHVELNGEILQNWNMFTVNDSTINRLTAFKKIQVRQGLVYFATFNVQKVADTFIKMTGWEKGQIYINNFNIGRYWQSAGPQKTLFVPSDTLQVGVNNLTILELGVPCSEHSVDFVERPLI